MLNKNLAMLPLTALLCVACNTPPTPQNYTEIGPYPAPPQQDEDRSLPIVYVSFIYTTNTPQARVFDNKRQMLKETQILNQYFVDENNHKIFRFKPYRYYSYQNFSKRKCELANQLNQPRPLVPENIPAAVKSCFPTRNAKEIFIIIYDAYNDKLKYNDVTSWGFRNNGSPFTLIDWKRLNYQIQAAQPHEMGHAFGLGHVCTPNATLKTPTNIMSSGECKLGTGGLRNIGFNQAQYNTIMKSYEKLN